MIMKFRRSVKSEKHESSKPAQTMLPPKDAVAIEPPKKVIKALYDWNGHETGDFYLSFQVGDFLHVVGRENDEEWYEACNPLKNERGLVPVKFFDIVGKTVRDSGGSGKSLGATAGHDSGYGENMGKMGVLAGALSNGAGGASAFNMGHRMSKSGSRNTAGLYGIVSYDFHAERPDELEAKEGEAIIVIAQSNPEWFVAKPITRLGGPGLIPVSFVELRDMTTGLAVADPLDAVRQAGIPRVEEWKKMAAEYKNTSIPLGMVSSTQQMQSLQQGLERMSMNQASGGGGGGGGSGEYGNGMSPQSRTSIHQQPQQAPQQQQNLFAPLRASVPRYVFVDDKFHFIVECKLSNGTHWDLSRIYEDFYELQINLINAFPEEAGQVPNRPRILPYMPGPVKFVTDNISEGRRANLDEYLRDLLRLKSYITTSALVRNFFAPRPSDYEVDPSSVDLEEHARPAQPQDRYSQASYSSQQAAIPQHPPPQHSMQPPQQSPPPQQQPYPEPQLPNTHQHSASQASNIYSHQRQQQSMASVHSTSKPPESHYRSLSEAHHQPAATLNPPPLPHQNSTSSTASSFQNPGTAINSSTAPVKVKAWFDRDTCVVIRMPARGSFDFSHLYQRIAERRRLEYRAINPGMAEELLEIEYRDELTEDYYRLEGDADLDVALARNEKLTLAVRKKECRGLGPGEGEREDGDVTPVEE